jgi:hypothetical protein
MKNALVIALFAAATVGASAHTPGTAVDAQYNATANTSMKVGVYQPTTVMAVYNSVNDLNELTGATTDANQRLWFNANEQKTLTAGFKVSGASARMFTLSATVESAPDASSNSYNVTGGEFMTVKNINVWRDNTPNSDIYSGVSSWTPQVPNVGATGDAPVGSGDNYQATFGTDEHIHLGWPEVYPNAPFSLSEYNDANNLQERFIKLSFDAKAGAYGTSGHSTITVTLNVIDGGAII